MKDVSKVFWLDRLEQRHGISVWGFCISALRLKTENPKGAFHLITHERLEELLVGKKIAQYVEKKGEK